MEKFKNNITFMSVDVTYKCNLRCLHCYNYSGEQNLGEEELSDNELLKLADDIGNIKPTAVCLCGGETLLRIDIICEMIKIIKYKTNNETSVNLVTNGMLLNEDVAKRLKKVGIDNVQISIDGLESTHNWLRQNKNSYKNAINALKWLSKYDIYTSVSCLPTKKNIDEYKSIIDMCRKYNVKSFRSQPLMILGRAKKNLQDYKLSDDEYYKITKLFDELRYDEAYVGMDFEWGDPVDHLVRSKSLGEKGILSIDAYGYIQTSPYIPINIGNIRNHSLRKYIEYGYEKYLDTDVIQEIYNMVTSAENLDVSMNSDLPEKNKDKSLYIDVIDEYDKLNCKLSKIVL